MDALRARLGSSLDPPHPNEKRNYRRGLYRGGPTRLIGACAGIPHRDHTRLLELATTPHDARRRDRWEQGPSC